MSAFKQKRKQLVKIRSENMGHLLVSLIILKQCLYNEIRITTATTARRRVDEKMLLRKLYVVT